MDDDTAHFVLEAVDMVATHGWKLLPQVRKIWYTTGNLIVWLPFKLDINHVQYIQFQVLFRPLPSRSMWNDHKIFSSSAVQKDATLSPGQRLPTLLDVTCCVRLHTLLHAVAKISFETGQNI